MKFLEKDLENIIYNHYEACHERGFCVRRFSKSSKSTHSIFRQVNLGVYGVADLVIVEINTKPYLLPYDYPYKRQIFITIVECKLNEINISAYQQAKKYVTGIKSLLDNSMLDNTDIQVNTVLVGSHVERVSDFVFVLNDDSNCQVFSYTYDIDGIKFKELKEWILRDEISDTIAKSCQTRFVNAFKEAIASKEITE